MAELADICVVAQACVDEKGYLLSTEEWSREVGQLLASGVVPERLTECHWKIVEYVRQYYLEFGMVPPVRKLCRDTGFSLKCIYKLFPSGLASGACRVAGIPSKVFLHPLAFLYP
ncbi:MAG: TusE/DsrC/DsvC family sulfur relay protein [Chloroflexota bacterium]